jgi:hypothetical protein
MKRLTLRALILLTASAVVISACGGRLPKTKTSEKTLRHYFHSYGHKYKGSDFTIYQIEGVRVLDVQEIHKKLVAVTAEIKLLGGPTYIVRCMMEKKTTRWKVMSWERIS